MKKELIIEEIKKLSKQKGIWYYDMSVNPYKGVIERHPKNVLQEILDNLKESQ